MVGTSKLNYKMQRSGSDRVWMKRDPSKLLFDKKIISTTKIKEIINLNREIKETKIIEIKEITIMKMEVEEVNDGRGEEEEGEGEEVEKENIDSKKKFMLIKKLA
eukprot:GHVR01041140.1.p4 GENE.GHVR01041140.1~~GHVR01041140.1.p4  ORF type:complete len:105 (+),score=22.89 GHVR01041140.1:3037-3351(+)